MVENVVFGLGSNLGNRFSNIKKAVKEISLSKGFNYLAKSSVYETEPWGYKNQNKFLNCVLVCLCRNDIISILRCIKNIERKIGRLKRKKWHPREIDIDILFYDGRILNSKTLTVPHPYLQYRNFVLEPLAELMPDFIHPVFKKNMKKLLKDSKDTNKVLIYREKI